MPSRRASVLLATLSDLLRPSFWPTGTASGLPRFVIWASGRAPVFMAMRRGDEHGIGIKKLTMNEANGLIAGISNRVLAAGV